MKSEMWIRDLVVALPKPELMNREQFVAKYMPEYATEYRPDYRIRTYLDKNNRLRIPQTTKGSIQAQVTKRNNRIDAAYEQYKTTWTHC